jgi:hypothetical protein
MADGSAAKPGNRGYCGVCHRVVPVAREVRDNHVYLSRDCPDCGHNETLISRDAKAYFEKRDFMGYDQVAHDECSFHCVNCKRHVGPSFVTIDVTNRCNMNCPICLANIPAMGMEFNPPLEYFDKLFRHVATLDPVPVVQLFGGEPTCRDDLLELLKLARKRGLRTRMVTNGIRLADEEYCRNVLATKPQLLLGLDGLNPAIQKKLRKNPGSLQKKLKAIENIEKYTKSKITLMCSTAVGISEELVPDLIKLAYDKRRLITRMMLIPLQATAGPELIGLESSTVEDVEHMMERLYPGLEFVPVGSLRLMKNLMVHFGQNMTMGGAHPNCECLSPMIADGDKGAYVPIAEFLKTSFKQAIRDLMAWDTRMGPKLKRGLLGRLFGKRGERAHIVLALAWWARRYVNLRKYLGPHVFRNVLRVLWGKIFTRRKFAELLARYMPDRTMLLLIILPYEEPGCLESARLIDCPVLFACEDPVTGEVDLIPFCAYFVHKNEILRKSTERWGTTPRSVEKDETVPEPAAAAK